MSLKGSSLNVASETFSKGVNLNLIAYKGRKFEQVNIFQKKTF